MRPDFHAMCPGNMVKPQEIFFGTGFDIVILSGQSFGILCNGITAFTAAVEAYSSFIGFVIVGRKPVGTGAGNTAPRFGAIMMSPCKNMMQTERHHVIYNRFMTVEHHLFELKVGR